MTFDQMITLDPYGIDHAQRPWNGVGAKESRNTPPAKKVQTYDPQEQIDRCLTCPIQKNKIKCGWKCSYRLGKEEPKKQSKPAPAEPKPPRGYDREALDRAMVHAYTNQELADALGISLYMVKKWLEWRYR